MVTTDVHQVRSASRLPVFLLPAALFVVLFCVAVLLAQVAPSRVTSGVYQVDVHYIDRPEPGPCAARYGDRAAPCMPVFGFYGHTSQTVWITDDLACWQWALSRASGRRVVSAVVATVAVTFYSGITMLVFLIQSGFDD